MIADYERKNFSISQCVWNEDANSDVGVIHSINYTAPPSAGNGTSGSSGSGAGGQSLTTGAIAGIVVAACVIVLVLAALAITRKLRKWPFHKRPLSGSAELDSNQIGHEADGRPFGKPRPNMPEADSKQGFYGPELVGSEAQLNKVELAGSEGRRGKNELPGAAVHRPSDHGELVGSNVASEVEGSHPEIFMELAGSPVPEYYGNSKAAAPVPSRAASSRHDGTLSPRSPLSQGTPGASPILPPTPRSARGSGLGSPLSEAQSPFGLRSSPVSSPGSGSRDPSRSRRRDREGGSVRDPSISPGGIGDGGFRGAREDVSREVSRSRTRGMSGHGHSG